MIFPRIDRAIWAGLRALWWKICRREVVVPGDVQEERVTECEHCVWLDREDRQCLDCTCFVDAKTWVASEYCRRGKWDIYLAKLRKRKHSREKL